MCKWGTDKELSVPVPANLSHTGEARWAKKKIDACIASIVDALNKAGILTAQSCCGHGKADGRIDLHDGRILIVKGYSGGRTVSDRLTAAITILECGLNPIPAERVVEALKELRAAQHTFKQNVGGQARESDERCPAPTGSGLE